jgi:hypothetical protein
MKGKEGKEEGSSDSAEVIDFIAKARLGNNYNDY